MMIQRICKKAFLDATWYTALIRKCHSNIAISEGRNNTILQEAGRQWSSGRTASSYLSAANGNWGGYDVATITKLLNNAFYELYV